MRIPKQTNTLVKHFSVHSIPSMSPNLTQKNTRSLHVSDLGTLQN